LGIGNSRPADFRPISIHVHRFVRAADNQGDWTGGRGIGVPFKLARSDRLAFFAALRKEKAGMNRLGWCGMLIGDNNGRAFHCDAEEQLGEFKW
jgi:hypothetical protein